jgi:hypothetical protein
MFAGNRFVKRASDCCKTTSKQEHRSDPSWNEEGLVAARSGILKQVVFGRFLNKVSGGLVSV